MDANANVNLNAPNVHDGGSQVTYLPARKTAEMPRDVHILINGMWPKPAGEQLRPSDAPGRIKLAAFQPRHAISFVVPSSGQPLFRPSASQ
jgi:hypothetical protein